MIFLAVLLKSLKFAGKFQLAFSAHIFWQLAVSKTFEVSQSSALSQILGL